AGRRAGEKQLQTAKSRTQGKHRRFLFPSHGTRGLPESAKVLEQNRGCIASAPASQSQPSKATYLLVSKGQQQALPQSTTSKPSNATTAHGRPCRERIPYTPYVCPTVPPGKATTSLNFK